MIILFPNVDFIIYWTAFLVSTFANGCWIKSLFCNKAHKFVRLEVSLNKFVQRCVDRPYLSGSNTWWALLGRNLNASINSSLFPTNMQVKKRERNTISWLYLFTKCIYSNCVREIVVLSSSFDFQHIQIRS